MPGHIKGNAQVMECLLERLVKKAGFALVKDGEQSTDLNLPKVRRTFFTRTYQIPSWFIELNGDITPRVIKFIYDRRTGFADFEVNTRDLDAIQNAMQNESRPVNW